MPYETDERLKSYLDTNQMHREQMCLAVLSIDRRFSDVRPRHPRGGPDRARDIEAVFNGIQRLFGAVGFVNQATDSDTHKKAAAKKFSDDMSEALRQDPRPEVFVFFTNVNLTAGEKDALVNSAKLKGLAHAEVFDRERIRIALDGPDGFSIRFQYLGIPLSEAEQATFFARWGDDIRGVISDGFGAIQESLNRIRFLQEATLPLDHFTIVMRLDKEYRAAEIGHFRAFAFVHIRTTAHGVENILFGSTDNISRPKAKTEEELATDRGGIGNGVCGAQWEVRMPEIKVAGSDSSADNGNAIAGGGEGRMPYELAGSFTSVGEDHVKSISIRYNKDVFFRVAPGPRLLDLDNCLFVISANSSLAQKVKSVHVYGNEYKLAEIVKDGLQVDPAPHDPEVPYIFSQRELQDAWVRIRPRNASTFYVRYSEQTPKRFFRATEVPPHSV
jgi:hypothetical protein